MFVGVMLTAQCDWILASPVWEDDDHSYDKARRAVEQGDAMPYDEVVRHLRSRYQWDIVATDYEYEFERWVYEFKVIDEHGKLHKFHLDAGTGEFLDADKD